jgi:hypothetical protein
MRGDEDKGEGDRVGKRENVLQVSQVAALHILGVDRGVMRGTIKLSVVFVWSGVREFWASSDGSLIDCKCEGGKPEVKPSYS